MKKIKTKTYQIFIQGQLFGHITNVKNKKEAYKKFVSKEPQAKTFRTEIEFEEIKSAY